MLKAKRKNIVVCFFAVFLLAFAAIVLFMTREKVNAEDAASDDIYNFTIIQDDDGSQSYSVSVKSAAKSTIVTAIIPNTYNGLPVTEIANNGFMSCKNLNKVYLPNTIKSIGSNAFMNCAKLERLNLSAA